MKFDFNIIETKWQLIWGIKPEGTAKEDKKGKKFYCLDMFPYPSGSGLHVGHWRGYTLSDVYARIKWLEGYNILHPMGWDAFGLPAENDAIKKGINPQICTAENIATFKRQLKEIGAIYDWTKEINTTDPDYYKWTQWIFTKMFEAGLAYEAETPINWCPSCLTGLANEEVVQGNCERCGTQVIQKKIRQWILKITDYAEKLLEGLDRLEWPEKVKAMQRNWIGKSEGLIFSSPVENSDIVLQTFSTHFEAFMADTFIVLAPDHPLLEKLLEGQPQKQSVLDFCNQIIERRLAGIEDKEPLGIFTGRYTIDPVGNGRLPIWVASFALADYGTGIIKCSAHDERDFKFAKKYNIPLKVVLVPQDIQLRKKVENFDICYTNTQEGILTEPTEFAGKIGASVRNEIIDYCQKKGLAVKKTQYKLRDWIFSRQRYWGEPIPIIHCSTCGIVPVPDDQLPVELPFVDKYQPTGTGESPLASIPQWVNTTCPKCNARAKRETNTMPQWAGSSWYFLRYPNPLLKDKPFDEKEMQYWLPVDLYVGGIEHAILHLLYARFYVKVLYDLGYLNFDEPFKHLFNQGMVLKYSEKTGLVEKMSKSKGNVVNPDEIVHNYGSDVLRMYILFIGPPEMDCQWQDSGLDGIKRFVNRLWNYLTDKSNLVTDQQETLDAKKRFHKFLKDYQDRLAHYKPNTAISSMMEWLNDVSGDNNLKIGFSNLEKLLVSLSVLAPHMASELLEILLSKKLSDCTWPAFDANLAKGDNVVIAIQVNGKLRANIEVKLDANQELIEPLAKKEIEKWLENKEIIKIIFVKNKIINFVIK